MSTPLYLGVDLGTSYFKVGLFDAAGALHGLGRVAVETQSPEPGRRELPTSVFWHLLRRGLSQALTQARADVSRIAGLSYSSQANTFVLLDKWDSPITPLVIWNDERAEPLEAALAEFSASAEFARTTGFGGWTGGFAIAKWRWFQQAQPELWARTRRVMTLADYFTFALTGETAGDAGTAAFLGLYDLGGKRWWPEALAACGIEVGNLSTPLAPGTEAGLTVKRATELLGVLAGLPFAVGGLDHHVAALGSGLGRFADVSISTGTVLAAITLVEEVTPRAECFHGPHFDGRRFYRLAFDPRGAGQLEDYQRGHAPEQSLEALVSLAAAASPGVLPGQVSKYRATTDTVHGEEMRFRMEKIAVAHRDLVRRVAGDACVRSVVATGGGARSELWMQIKADMLGVPVMTPATPERACLGAAMLASVAAVRHRDVAAAMRAMVREGRKFEPEPGNAAFYRARFQ